MIGWRCQVHDRIKLNMTIKPLAVVNSIAALLMSLRIRKPVIAAPVAAPIRLLRMRHARIGEHFTPARSFRIDEGP